MIIATLNLNGETFFSINRRPRLPQSLFNIDKIKKKLTHLICKGIRKLLDKDIYDVIAIQELVNITKIKDEIAREVSKKGYKLLLPEIGARAHFTVGFIVRKNMKATLFNDEDSKENDLPKNRCAILGLEDKEKQYYIVNWHVNNYKISVQKADGNVILLGDMNADTKDQCSENYGKNSEFLDRINKEGYTYVGEDKDYTWTSNGIEKKLDHIFLSNTLFSNISASSEIKTTKDDTVNYYYDEDNGFTDHSMLVMEIKDL